MAREPKCRARLPKQPRYSEREPMNRDFMFQKRYRRLKEPVFICRKLNHLEDIPLSWRRIKEVFTYVKTSCEKREGSTQQSRQNRIPWTAHYAAVWINIFTPKATTFSNTVQRLALKLKITGVEILKILPATSICPCTSLGNIRPPISYLLYYF